MTSMATADIREILVAFCLHSMDVEDGRLYPYPGIAIEPARLGEKPKTELYSFDLHPASVMKWFVEACVSGKFEQVGYAIDRHTKPGQGTKHDSLITVACWVDKSLHIGVIDFNVSPRIIEPVNWENSCWNKLVRKELGQFIDMRELEG